MQQVTIIGQVVDTPLDCTVNGKQALRFTVRAENSPKDGGSSFDFEVVAGSLALRERLAMGASIYVSGLLSISEKSGRTTAVIQGLVFSLIDRARSMEDIKLEMVSRAIPLQGI